MTPANGRGGSNEHPRELGGPPVEPPYEERGGRRKDSRGAGASVAAGSGSGRRERMADDGGRSKSKSKSKSESKAKGALFTAPTGGI
jgi:hypothetical protein